MTASAETTSLAAAKTFLADLGAHLGQLIGRIDTVRAALATRGLDVDTLTRIDRVRAQTDVMAAFAAAGVEHLTDYHAQMEQAVTNTPEAADTSFYQSATAGAGDSEQQRAPASGSANAIRIAGGDGADIVVTPYAGAVRIDLADEPDDPEWKGPQVVLDEAGAAALAEAAEAMQAAEKTGREAYKKLDAKIRRLERRRERLEDQRHADRGAEYVKVEQEFDELTRRGDQLHTRIRERVALLSADERAAYDALEDQLTPDGDRRAIRDAQRRIIYAMTDAEIVELYDRDTAPERRRELRARPGGMPDADFGRRSLHLNDQDQADKIAARKAELRRQVAAIPQVPLSAQAEAELASVKADITEAEEALGDMTDWQTLASGVIPTQDGAGLAWQTVMTDDGKVHHQLDRRPADADANWYIGTAEETPRMSSAQLRQLVQAVTGG